MKLFYVRNTCALAPLIALNEAGIEVALDRIDLKAGKKTSTGRDYLELNPKGYVPALELDDGEVLTEVPVILQYIADLRPESGLAPAPGTRERVRLQEWLNFIATELHKGMSPFYQPWAPDDFKAAWKEHKLAPRLNVLDKTMAARTFLFGNGFTVADAYAFYPLRAWQVALGQSLGSWTSLSSYFMRLAERPSVKAALEAIG